MANATRADKPVQDILKVRLLCKACEERFSKYESYFSSKIFYPYHDGSKSFEYDCNLELFAISLSWRSLKISYDSARSKHPDLVPRIDEAESRWRSFLLGKTQTAGPYESHLVFLGGETGAGRSLRGSDWYKLQSADPTLIMSKNLVYAYSKLPHMFVSTSIYPHGMKRWNGTVIKTSGNMTTSQRIDDAGFKTFFSGRARKYLTSSPGLSAERSAKKLEKAMKRDPQRVMRSESVGIMFKEKDSDRNKKMERMPELVRVLVDSMILRDAYDLDTEHGQCVRLASSRAADIFAALLDGESLKLDRVIRGVIDESVSTRKHTRDLFKTDSLWVVFMSYHNATTDRQKSEIEDEIYNLQLQQNEVKTPIVVFSLNVEGVDALSSPVLQYSGAPTRVSAKIPCRDSMTRLADVFWRCARENAQLSVVFFDIPRNGGNVMYVSRRPVRLCMQSCKVRGIDVV